jgi:hypothetical protein
LLNTFAGGHLSKLFKREFGKQTKFLMLMQFCNGMMALFNKHYLGNLYVADDYLKSVLDVLHFVFNVALFHGCSDIFTFIQDAEAFMFKCDFNKKLQALYK